MIALIVSLALLLGAACGAMALLFLLSGKRQERPMERSSKEAQLKIQFENMMNYSGSDRGQRDFERE